MKVFEPNRKGSRTASALCEQPFSHADRKCVRASGICRQETTSVAHHALLNTSHVTGIHVTRQKNHSFLVGKVATIHDCPSTTGAAGENIYVWRHDTVST